MVKEFKRESRIVGPGSYRFATVGDWDGHGDPYGIANNAIYSREQPNFRWGAITKHLAEIFPDVKAQIFVPFVPGTREKVEIIDVDEWDGDGVQRFLKLEDKMFWVESSGRSSQGYDDQEFVIQDISKITIENNRLVISYDMRTNARDGKVTFRMEGSEPGLADTRGIPAYWRGWFDVSGTNPGKMVTTAIEYMNSEVDRLKIPVWKKK